MTFTKILSRIFIANLLLFSINTLFAQHPIFIAEKINTIGRIDSMTMDLLKHESEHSKKINVFEQPITEELFYEKMKTLGSKFNFEYNSDVAKQILYMTNPASKFMFKTLPNSSVYFPIFEEIIDKRRLPGEIKFLSVIESALNPNAVSWCGAAGLWQFMPGTGKLMHLEINGEIDERKDIMLSTEKALTYLENMHAIYGDWFMALAAYNCGPGNLNKAKRRSGGKTDFWGVRPYLPRETQQYIPKFVAAVFVMNFVDVNALFACEEKFCKIVPVELDKPINLSLASAFLNWEEGFISEYNAFYKMDFVPENYINKRIYLPYYAAMQFLEMKDSIYIIQQKSIQNNLFQTKQRLSYHKVRKGETLYKIASNYGVTADDIIRWNRLSKKTVYTGQSLKIYKSLTPEINYNFEPGEFKYYVIIDEVETLTSICEKISICDAQKTLEINELVSVDEPLSRGTLIKIIPKSENP